MDQQTLRPGNATYKSVAVSRDPLGINLTDGIPASYSSSLAHDTESLSCVGGKYKETPFPIVFFFSYKFNDKDSVLIEGYSSQSGHPQGCMETIREGTSTPGCLFLGGLGGT